MSHAVMFYDVYSLLLQSVGIIFIIDPQRFAWSLFMIVLLDIVLLKKNTNYSYIPESICNQLCSIIIILHTIKQTAVITCTCIMLCYSHVIKEE